MSELTLIVSLAGGLVLLAFAGDFLVSGSVTIARRLGLSPLVAGIFIVGFGTSAPEMIVALDAAGSGFPNLAIGNIVGSNIANILLVLGLPALVMPVQAGNWGQRRAWLAMALATAAWIAILATIGFSASVAGLFLAGLVVYAVATLASARSAARQGTDTGIEADPAEQSLLRAVTFTLVGLAGLPIGAHLIVDGGVGLARAFDIPEEVIGLTLLAVGTSLPEIGAGIAAAIRGRTDVVIGNILGSNIFNILGAGGLVAFYGTFDMAASFPDYDHWIMAITAAILGLVILLKARIGRLGGMLFLLLYALYVYGLVNGWSFSAAFDG